MEEYEIECGIHHHEEITHKVHDKMLPASEYDNLGGLFKLFGDPTRLKILHALEQQEMAVCCIADTLGMTKSAISHQLKDLRMANLVKNRREGTTVYYSLADDHVKSIIDIGLEHLNEE